METPCHHRQRQILQAWATTAQGHFMETAINELSSAVFHVKTTWDNVNGNPVSPSPEADFTGLGHYSPGPVYGNGDE